MLEVVTDAQLDELYENIAHSTHNWVIGLAQDAIAELRELRAERKNFDSALEEQMRRGDEYWADNQRLRVAYSELENDVLSQADQIAALQKKLPHGGGQS